MDKELAEGVPSVAGWRLAGLPQHLEPEQVEALLACCDTRTTRGLRDLAILKLLVRLGLRRCEVVRLAWIHRVGRSVPSGSDRRMTSCAGLYRLNGAAGACGQEVTFVVHDDEPVGLDGLQVDFDDERAVSDAGVMVVATLAQRLGIEALAGRLVRLRRDRPGAANAGRKVMALIFAMVLGAASIDDAEVLRAGRTRPITKIASRILTESDDISAAAID